MAAIDRFRVVGGARLVGEVSVSGAKNSALKLMAASLLAAGKTTIRNLLRMSSGVSFWHSPKPVDTFHSAV